MRGTLKILTAESEPDAVEASFQVDANRIRAAVGNVSNAFVNILKEDRDQSVTRPNNVNNKLTANLLTFAKIQLNFVAQSQCNKKSILEQTNLCMKMFLIPMDG